MVSKNASFATILFAGTAGVLLMILKWRKTQQRRKHISELWVYPIKGCRGFFIQQAVITRRGLKHDRMMMVVNEENKFISQRSHPMMTLINTRIDEINSTLILSAPNMSDLHIPLPRCYDSSDEENKELIQVTVWSSTCDAYEISESASYWMSKFLSRDAGKPENLKLVRMSSTCVRRCKNTENLGQTGFADGYPFLLASRESLNEVKKRTKTPFEVTLEHFRPNIVLENCQPFEEDSWKSISIGETSINMQVVSPCSRCKVPTNDPNSGIFNRDNEPSRTLKTFRQGSDLPKQLGLSGKEEKELYFGMNLDHRSLNEGTIRVGDIVRFVEV